MITFSICSGTVNTNGNPALSIYPNPFNQNLHLSLDKIADVFIYDSAAKLIEKLTEVNGDIEFGYKLPVEFTVL
ncbi:MAG: hypothetical protein IPL24_13865 [Bacteroidetes bacterium]|nr:hypothetical protein [Bacteroidota bacterium]